MRAGLLVVPEQHAHGPLDSTERLGGSFWHVIGLCRFDPPELDPYIPGLRLPDDAVFRDLSPPDDRFGGRG